jgi:hypothetical protein
MRSKEKWVTESKANRQEEPGDEELLVLHFIYIYIYGIFTLGLFLCMEDGRKGFIPNVGKLVPSYETSRTTR